MIFSTSYFLSVLSIGICFLPIISPELTLLLPDDFQKCISVFIILICPILWPCATYFTLDNRAWKTFETCKSRVTKYFFFRKDLSSHISKLLPAIRQMFDDLFAWFVCSAANEISKFLFQWWRAFPHTHTRTTHRNIVWNKIEKLCVCSARKSVWFVAGPQIFYY